MTHSTGCLTGSAKISLAAILNKVCLSFLVYWLVLLSASIFCLGFLSECTAAIVLSVSHQFSLITVTLAKMYCNLYFAAES